MEKLQKQLSGQTRSNHPSRRFPPPPVASKKAKAARHWKGLDKLQLSVPQRRAAAKAENMGIEVRHATAKTSWLEVFVSFV